MEEILLKVASGKLLVKQAQCPKGCSLINPAILLSGYPSITAVNRMHGKTGLIHLNALYGVFEYHSELELKEGDVVDLYCPHCDTHLGLESKCNMCNATMFALHLTDGGEIQACPTVGCHRHGLTIVDVDAQIAEYFNEERRILM
jgi:hypothetical protein